MKKLVEETTAVQQQDSNADSERLVKYKEESDGEDNDTVSPSRGQQNGSRGKKRRPSIHDSDDGEGDFGDSDDDDDDDDNNYNDADEEKSKTIKVEEPTQLGRKQSAAAKVAIPKKVRKNENNDSTAKDPTQPSRLMQHLKSMTPLPSSQPMPATSSPKGTTIVKASPGRKKPPTTSENAAQSVKREPLMTHQSVKREPATAPLAAAAAPLQHSKNGKQGLWQKLETMCTELSDAKDSGTLQPLFQLGNINASSSKNSGGGVDLSGSFLRGNDRYDFFDTNAAGEIVVEPRRPIFPEDFTHGRKEHPLSWWGVLDPVQGQGKFAPTAALDHRIPPPPPHAPPAPLQTQGGRGGGGRSIMENGMARAGAGRAPDASTMGRRNNGGPAPPGDGPPPWMAGPPSNGPPHQHWNNGPPAMNDGPNRGPYGRGRPSGPPRNGGRR